MYELMYVREQMIQGYKIDGWLNVWLDGWEVVWRLQGWRVDGLVDVRQMDIWQKYVYMIQRCRMDGCFCEVGMEDGWMGRCRIGGCMDRLCMFELEMQDGWMGG